MSNPSRIKILFLIGITLQLLFLAGLAGYKQYAFSTGTEIILKTMPIDPRSLFQGDYARLNYEINRIDITKVESEKNEKFLRGAKIYVTLEKQGEYFLPKKVSTTKPDTKYFIRGTTINASDNLLNIQYGIETYFMPEGKAMDFERAARERQGIQVLVGLRVSGVGQGMISKIIIEGKEIDASNFEEVTEVSKMYTPRANPQISADYNDFKNIQYPLSVYFKTKNSYPVGPRGGVPVTEIESVFQGKIPSNQNIIWIDNRNDPQAFCIYISSINSEWLYMSSKEEGIARSEPQTLEDCGVKKPIATIEGFVFLDKNSNAKMDAGESAFRDINISIMQFFRDTKDRSAGISQSEVGGKLSENGAYSFEIFIEGEYTLFLSPRLSTPITIKNIVDGNVATVKNYEKPPMAVVTVQKGKAIKNYNFAVSF